MKREVNSNSSRHKTDLIHKKFVRQRRTHACIHASIHPRRLHPNFALMVNPTTNTGEAWQHLRATLSSLMENQIKGIYFEAISDVYKSRFVGALVRVRRRKFNDDVIFKPSWQFLPAVRKARLTRRRETSVRCHLLRAKKKERKPTTNNSNFNYSTTQKTSDVLGILYFQHWFLFSFFFCRPDRFMQLFLLGFPNTSDLFCSSLNPAAVCHLLEGGGLHVCSWRGSPGSSAKTAEQQNKCADRERWFTPGRNSGSARRDSRPDSSGHLLV